MNDRDTAIRLLVHYLRMVWKQAGLHWDGENEGEIEALVDCLIGAAVAAARPAPDLAEILAELGE
jgi:hypothetical protein